MQAPKQLKLQLSPIGQGDSNHHMSDDRITKSLKRKADETYQMIVRCQKEYVRVSPDLQELILATKKKSHETWVTFKGERWSYETVRSMRKFVESYQSEQCERVKLLKALIAALKVRGVEIEISENIMNIEGC